MLGLGSKHVVDAGMVYYSARDRDVTVERCLSCVALRAISRESAPDGSEVRIVRCDPPSQLVRA